MALTDLTDWLDEQTALDRLWFVKRLSANDTGLTGSNQAGVYAPKPMIFDLFPSIYQETPKCNRDAYFTIYIDSHLQRAEARAIWYCNKYWKTPQSNRPRDEMRITRFGGTPLQESESTGALALFSFVRSDGDCQSCHVWLCDESIEEDLIEERTGPIDPSRYLIWEPAKKRRSSLFEEPTYRSDCHLQPDELPEPWRNSYPTGMEIVDMAVRLRPDAKLPPDKRLVRRRKCEYEIFLSIEEAIELPVIRAGFTNLDEFISHAQTMLQRRKSRSGRSLELHARAILIEEGLVEGNHFEWQPKTEQGNTPDFLFPNARAYHDSTFPSSKLRLLAAKTTCRDRWRQVAREGDRVKVKHLLTLQQGVSENQFQQMRDGGVQLVVPQGLIQSYPKSIQAALTTLESFIGDVRACLP